MLFMVADKVNNKQEQNLLFEQFEQHEDDVMGHGAHERLHAMIHTWAEAFGVE